MAMNFDFEALAANLQADAMTDKKKYEVDTRFWKLSRDEQDNGGALIRFIPDANGIPFVKITRINAQRGRNQPFVSELSPETIGLPNPFQERFSELWNAGEKEKAKEYGRQFRFYTNIKVIKDPANPSNEGKIFLYDMSPTMMDMIKNAIKPSEAELALGAEALAVYNPLAGNNFLVKVKMGTNKIISYSDSKFADKVNGIYGDATEAETDIVDNTHSLKAFLEPSAYLSYDELKAKLAWYDGDTSTKATTETPAQTETTVDTGLNLGGTETETTKPATKAKVEVVDDGLDDLDDLLADIA